MKDNIIYILFDNVLLEYINKFGEENIKDLIKELHSALSELHKNYKITLITNQNAEKMYYWIKEYHLDDVVDSILNSVI
jgi:FMN phosphatase YigB (HAD superfamily)